MKLNSIQTAQLDFGSIDNMLAKLEMLYSKHGLVSYRHDGTTCEFLSEDLSNLDFYDSVYSVTLGSLKEDFVSHSSELFSLAKEWSEKSQKNSCINWEVSDVDRYHSISLSTGLNKLGFFVGVATPLLDTRLNSDKTTRANIFDSILSVIGRDAAKVKWSNEDFFVEVGSPFSLHTPMAEAEGRNPHSIQIGGFSSVDEVLSIGTKLITSLSYSRVSTSFMANFSESAYNEFRNSPKLFNYIWKGVIYGEPKMDIHSVLKGEQIEPYIGMSIPVFHWLVNDDNRTIVAFIGIEKGSARLILNSVDVEISEMLKLVEPVEGLNFDISLDC